MFLPEVAYYSTNNPNHVFSLSFLKVCIHTILNKSQNIVFTSTCPHCLVFALDWLQASISSYFTALLPIRRLSFLSHMQVPFFWITVFVNILQLPFSIYFFLTWTWLFDRQTLVSVCLYTEEPRLATTPLIRPPLASDHLPYSLSTQTWKSPSHFIILKTSLMRPPRYISRPEFYDPALVASTGFHCIF